MSWKLRLSLVVVMVLVAVIWIKLPSQADTNPTSSPSEDKISFQQDKITRYENGIARIKPQNFAVSGAVRDMPKIDPDALVNRANFVDPEKQREESMGKKNQESGFFAQFFAQEDEGEINELNSERIRKIVPGAGAGYSPFEDPLIKKQSKLNQYGPESPQAMPTPSLTFNGATQADNAATGQSGYIPPDVNGDVGPNHYVSSVNLVLKMFNKSGATVAGPIRTNSLFASLPTGDPCRLTNSGDPVVIYDSLADRWHISQFGLPSGTYLTYQCVALSVTNDPTGAYYVWSYAYPLAAFNDYPKVGVWSDGYHMTFNQFAPGGGQLGLGILTQDRKKALVGDPTAGAVFVNVGDLDQNTGGALPGDIDGFVAPPVGLAEVIGEYRSDESGDPVDGVRMYKWVPNFDSPANSTLTVLGDVQLAPFDGRYPRGRAQVEQLGGAPLDAIPDRSMHRFAYRNFGTTENPVNSYAGNFSVNVSGVNPTTAATYQAAVRWFEMRRAGDAFSVFDQGTHNLTPGDGANGLNNWMGSVAQDNRGDIAIGFSQAGTNQRADIKIAGRTNNIQNSGTLNEGEALMHAATGSQIPGAILPGETVPRNPGNRWGDYSAMNVDPTDDCTFWYTQEYYAVTGSSSWSTRVGKFRFPQCTDAPKGVIQGTVTNCATGAVISGAAIDTTNGFNRVSVADGTFSLTASPATYTVSARKLGFLPSSSQTVTVGAGQTQTASFCLVPTSAVSTSINPQITSESCGVSNNAPDPGEQITVSLPLQNNGAAPTSNLTATLQASGGVTNPSAAQNFGAIAPNGSATQNFTFTVDPNVSCGSNITLTFNLNDGANSLGTVTKTYSVGGARIQTFSENFDGVTPPALPAGWTNVQLFGTGINWVTKLQAGSSTNNIAFANAPTTKHTTALISPAIQIQTTEAQLSFRNQYNTELDFDGMVLEFSIDNGATWRDVISGGGSFASGGYNEGIATYTDSTLAGRLAWTGTSSGFVNTLVNLPASLNNQTVKFRWVMGTDASVTATSGVPGVSIDDVQVFGARQCNSNCVTTPPVYCQFRNRYQFDTDTRADISVFRPETGMWYLLNSQTGFNAVNFGISTDKIVPADYDGDCKTDIAVYRNGTWYLQRSSAGFASIQFGLADDIPQPADFDGDGKADLAVYRPSTGTWYVLNLANNQITAVSFGLSTDKPVVSDYDGDGKADYAVYRPSNGTWYMMQSGAGFAAVQFGISTDKPVVGDYDGDGKADQAVYRPESGNWYLLRSRDGFTAVNFGLSSDLPVPADYDGDGKTDIAVYRPATATWYQLKSTEGFGAVQFGISTDKPVPNAFVP
jgi:Carboxypeptidase regulatory-like domain/FG-GAP-like repeat